MTQYTVEKLGHRGDGLIRSADATWAIPKILPGEIVEINHGRLQQIITPSPDRISAFCKHYESCGGCKFQHWRAEPYAGWKRGLLLEALKTRNIKTEVDALVDAHGNGRRRVTLHVREQQGKWQAGFMEPKSHDLCAIDNCPVMVPALAKASTIAAAFGPNLGACDVSVTAADNGLDVAIKAERKIVLRRLGAMNDIVRNHGILRLSVNGETHTSLADPMVTMGKASVTLPLQSFLQATQLGEATLGALVCENLTKSKSVADLFCGLGSFTFRLAEKTKVTAIDADRFAIKCLDAAARTTQSLKPITAQARDLFRAPLIATELREFDAVVFDPPRAGAEAQAQQLAKSTVKRVVAIACDIGNFTRDAAILIAGGYKLRRVTPVDQFKWTAHLEMVGVFERS